MPKTKKEPEHVADAKGGAIGTLTVIYPGPVNLRSAPSMVAETIVGQAESGDTFTAVGALEENGHKWYALDTGQFIRADKEFVTL